MGLSNRQFARARAEPRHIPTGRQTQINNGYTSTLSPFRSRTGDVLKTLRSIPEEAAAIEYLKRVNPDISMAVWNFVRLANQGNEMHFYAIDGKTRRTDLEDRWRDFASRINEISNSGLDGLIDQLHHSSFLLGAMGVEVEVTPNRKDIYDVYPVKPQTIEWELKEIKGRKIWVPFQCDMHKKIYLDKEHANFFWVPTDPDIGDPRGTLTMTPVLQAIDFQMQILQDLQAVLHHQGYPRNDITIMLDRLMTYCPPHVKNNPKELRDWLNKQHDDIRNAFENIAPDSDYIHFDDVEVDMNKGANGGRSLDVRAITEMLDTQTLSGLKQMAIFMNRNQGVTESWGTVQFKIFVSGINSCQRGSKRIIEEIARLWLRVNGEQAIAKFKHDIVDWESEEQRLNVNLMKQQFYVIAQLMDWIGADKAAQEVMGVEKAIGNKPSENIRISLSNGGVSVDNDKHSREEKPLSIEGTI
jgi:hypothetical protein